MALDAAAAAAATAPVSEFTFDVLTFDVFTTGLVSFLFSKTTALLVASSGKSTSTSPNS